jgi:sigma-B regulation protein RsbU (phosphoserine phosphatase)
LVDASPRHDDVADHATAVAARRETTLAYALLVELARLGARFNEQAEMRTTLERSLLPEALLPVPGLQLASRYLPAARGQQVGGDFYDAVRTGDGAVLIVGDVQGKGVEAATLTSLARHTLRAAALAGADPADMLGQLNRALLYGQAEAHEAGNGDAPRFVTAAVAALSPSGDGFDVVLARAGQPPPIVVRWSGDIELFEPGGLLLGVLESPTFELARTHLGPSDTLVLYTDGVTEQRAPESTFDETQLGLLVRHRLAAIDADAIAQAILDTVLLVAPEGSRDDIAVLVASPTTSPTPPAPDAMLER